MSSGFSENCDKRSTITLRGGGGITLPGITMFLGPIGAGGTGGLSLISKFNMEWWGSWS